MKKEPSEAPRKGLGRWTDFLQLPTQRVLDSLTVALVDVRTRITSAATTGGDAGNTSAPKTSRHRQFEDDSDRAHANWFEYMLVVVLASLLLLGSLTLAVFWVVYYREGFAWTENPKLQFNLHPVLMVAGFISFSGFSILLYRICRCCRRIHVKLFHTIFHALAIPCVVVGFMAALDWHNNSDPAIPNFYTLHSWLGLVTMGLFALQFVVGFFSFLILLCCEGATAAFRASLVPIHASFGITTFMLAIATCLTGLTQKAHENFGFTEVSEEIFVMNGLGIVLALSAVVVAYIVMREDLRYHGPHCEEIEPV